MNLEKRLMNYVIDIIEGDIVACQKHIWACQRFLNDLELIQTGSSPFYFDMEKLYDFYEWSKQFKHYKGVLNKQPIELTDFQLFIAANIFCFLDKKTQYRRFLRAFIELGRKNAKSQFLALIGSYITFLSDQQEECYIAGWGRQQSSLVYNDIVKQLSACEIVQGKYTTSYGKVTHLKSGSVIVPLSKEAKKTGDGTNPSLGIVDEYHNHETSEIYDVIDSGMGARPNTLMFIITTAGFNLASPCYKEYLYTSQILDPNNKAVENEEYFAIICELDEGDDIKDESNWIKANPIVATYEEGIKKLRSDLKVALATPEKMRSFLTKRMNIWVNMRDGGYMDLSRWRKCQATDDKPMIDLTGMDVYCGIDLSKKIDLTSAYFVVPCNGVYYVFGHSFMPEDTFTAKMNTDKVPYDLWVKEGYITLTPDAVIDYEFVEAYIINLAKEKGFNIKEIDYDPYNSTQFAHSMEKQGYEMVEIRQGIRTLGEATKDFRDLVYKQEIIHDGDPVLWWAMGNAVTKQDAQENIMLDKDKSTERIDPLAATINAFTRARLDEFSNIDLNKYIMSDEFSF